MRDAVVVTGLGAQTQAAVGVREFEALLRRGAPRPQPALDPGCLQITADPAELERRLRQHVHRIPASFRLPRRAGTQLALGVLAAAEAFWGGAGTLEVPPDRLAVHVAGEGQTGDVAWGMQEAFAREPASVRPGDVQRVWATDLAAAIAEQAGARGESLVVGGASAAGNCALLVAARAIAAGACDAALVVSTYDRLDPATVQAFANVGALSVDGVGGLPLDTVQHGLVLAQASAAVLLESAQHARERGRAALAVIAGGAIRTDGQRGTRPALDSQVHTMRLALQESGLQPDEIDLVNMHATGTSLGDRTELAGVREVFGDDATVQATKALVGHSLGSASLLEAVACCLQIAGGFVHATPTPRPIDPGLLQVGLQRDIRNVLSNAYAFGGLNTSVVFSHPSRPYSSRGVSPE